MSNEIQTKGKRSYTKSEKFLESRKEKEFDLSEINQKYWDDFKDIKWPNGSSSLPQYRCTICNLMLQVSDIALLTREQLEEYLKDEKNENTRNNKISHIKSILSHIVTYNVENCLDRMTKETLVMIISM